MALLEPNLDPSRRELRLFAAFWWPLFFALIGGSVIYGSGSLRTAVGIWIGAAIVSLLGLLFPPFMRFVYIGLVRLTLPIGLALSWLLLAGIYFLVITPIGLASRVLRPDPLQRARDAEATSYWIRYDPPDEADRYFEQF